MTVLGLMPDSSWVVARQFLGCCPYFVMSVLSAWQIYKTIMFCHSGYVKLQWPIFSQCVIQIYIYTRHSCNS